MQWTRSQTLALASQSCVYCYGLGLRQGRGDRTSACNCVLRAIFRECLRRFQSCAAREKYISRVSMEANPGRKHRAGIWGMKNEEYIADFCNVAKRVLGGPTENDPQADSVAYKIFRWHFVIGADWPLCAAKLGWNRGEVYHEVYRIMQRLGRAYAELEPYALWPIDQYFSRGGAAVEEEPLKARAA